MTARELYDMKRDQPVKITLPGTYLDMPNETYHEQTEWLSSSMLKALLPEHYKAGGSQEALDFGTLFHTAVLEPDNLAEYVALDAEKIGVKADGSPAANPTMTAAWKKAVAEAEADGKKVIPQSELDQALAMREAVMAHGTARELLTREGAVEESVFEVVDGVKCRARFDKRIPGVIVDLKSTSAKPGRESLRRAVIDYGYDVSAAHYLAVAEAHGIADVQAFALVFCSKTEPHRVTVADLDESFLQRGRALRAKAIARHMQALDAYDGATGYLTLSCPRWAEIDALEIPA